MALVGNDYRISEERIGIEIAGGTLDAVLVRPRDGDASGLVVMVHGDGPVEATLSMTVPIQVPAAVPSDRQSARSNAPSPAWK